MRAAAARGVCIEAREFPEDTRTAADAARAIGCDLGQIVKSLVFTIDGAPVVVLVSGANRVDEAKLAAAVGGGVVDRATAGAARAATGYPIGGVPPFAHDRVLRTLVDDDLMAFDVVWAAAGTPRAVFAIEPEELVRLSAASGADLAQRDGG